MKIVTLTKDLRPWGKGESPVLPDEVADRLVKDGEAKDPRPFPPQDVAPRKPVGKVLEEGKPVAPTRLAQAHRYLTRKR